MVTAYLVLVALVALERLVELVVSTRNVRWALARGGVETGRGHYPVMVLIHVGLLVGCVLEVTVGGARPTAALAVPMLVLVVAAQALRWWCIATLGRRWNTRVVVVPGLPLIRRSPYRFLRHPNYVAVVVEGVALPLVGSAWITAVAFTVANAFLLRTRLRCENRALATAPTAPGAGAGATDGSAHPDTHPATHPDTHPDTHPATTDPAARPATDPTTDPAV